MLKGLNRLEASNGLKGRMMPEYSGFNGLEVLKRFNGLKSGLAGFEGFRIEEGFEGLSGLDGLDGFSTLAGLLGLSGLVGLDGLDALLRGRPLP
jgi:hypothetical protein